MVSTGYGTVNGRTAGPHQMSSYHTAVVNVALGDGSVKASGLVSQQTLPIPVGSFSKPWVGLTTGYRWILLPS